MKVIIRRTVETPTQEVNDVADVQDNETTQVSVETFEQQEPEEERIKYTNATTIKNLSYDQREILWNIMQMHNGGKPFDADMTASCLNFYKDSKTSTYVIPEPRILMDTFPQRDDIIKLDPWGPLPLCNDAIGSMVVDLPFVISPRTCKSMVEKKEGASLIANRFASYYPVSEMFTSYKHWLEEAYRVLEPGGILVWKCQNTISSSKFYATEEYSWMKASEIGFYTLDKFTLAAKARLISGKVHVQKHARNYTSVFWVFQKPGKYKPIPYNELENYEPKCSSPTTA